MEQVRDFETFEPSQIITPDDYPLPKEGHIGYVKFENPQEYAELCERQWGDVDDMGDLDDDCFGVIYPAILDEIDPLHDSEPEVEIVNAPFDMAKVICTT